MTNNDSTRGEIRTGDFVIRTHHLSRQFGALRAVDNLDLEIPSGLVSAFLGPNGAGKTTTLRMLLGLIKPTSGGIHLFGQPLDSKPAAVLRRVGSLVDNPSLYGHLTGRENLELTRLALEVDRSRIDHVLGVVDLRSAAHRLVREYSHGMRQRLGLALSLLGAPDLLILDEPTNGLDPAGIQEMRELLRRLPREEGVTIFLSSHLLSEVEQLASHLVIVQHGRCVFQGDPDDLRAANRESILVDVDRPGAAADLLRASGWAVLTNSDEESPSQAEIGRICIDGKSADDRARICHLLVTAGHSISHLSQHQSTLESVFLELTETESGSPR